MLGGGPYEATTCPNAAARCGTADAKTRIASIIGTRKKRRERTNDAQRKCGGTGNVPA